MGRGVDPRPSLYIRHLPPPCASRRHGRASLSRGAGGRQGGRSGGRPSPRRSCHIGPTTISIVQAFTGPLASYVSCTDRCEALPSRRSKAVLHLWLFLRAFFLKIPGTCRSYLENPDISLARQASGRRLSHRWSRFSHGFGRRLTSFSRATRNPSLDVSTICWWR